MKENKFGWIALVEGILLIILGIFSLVCPGRMLVGYVFLYAIAAVITGIVEIALYVKMESKTGFAPILSLVTGVLSIIAGIVLFFFPGAGLWMFAIWFPIWLIVHCISRMSHLGATRAVIGNGAFYGGIALNVLGIILACVMIFHPAITLVTLTYILGIFLIITGIDCIVAAFNGETKPN